MTTSFIFPGRCKISKAAAKEASRYAFHYGRYKGGYVAVSTGRVLVRIPVDLEDPNKPGKEFYLCPEALAVLSKGRDEKKVEINDEHTQVRIQDTGSQAVSIFPVDPDGKKFPDVDDLLAGYSTAPKYSICLNVRYLLDVAQAMDAEAVRVDVWENDQPVLIEPLGSGDGYGIGLIEQQEDEPVQKRGVGKGLVMPITPPTTKPLDDLLS